MKQIIFSLYMLLIAGNLFSQEVFNPGIVKGKHVTYRVKKHYSVRVTVTNVHNPDSTMKYGQDSMMVILPDMIGWQIAKIVHDHLSLEERQRVLDNKDPIEMYLR